MAASHLSRGNPDAPGQEQPRFSTAGIYGQIGPGATRAGTDADTASPEGPANPIERAKNIA
jgi:hypothetical protein